MTSSKMALEIIEALMSSTDHDISMFRFIEKLKSVFDADKVFLFRDIPHFMNSKKGLTFESSISCPEGEGRSVILDESFINTVKNGYCWEPEMNKLFLSFQSAWEVILVKMDKSTELTQLQKECVDSLQNPVAQVLGIMEHTKMYVNEIEERKKIEKENKTLHKKLIENAYKDGIAENAISVIHNIGNLLTPIKSRLELLSEDRERTDLIAFIHECAKVMKEQKTQNENLPEIFESIYKQLEVKQNQLIDESHFMLKQMELISSTISVQQKYANLKNKAKSMVSFSDIIDEAINVYRSDFDKYKIMVNEQIDFKGKIVADANGLHYLVGNALLNALESICERKQEDSNLVGRISCSLKSNDQMVQLVVLDNGLGLKNNDIKNLFSFGFTTKETGNGFGLHNMANFVKSHSGEIFLKNNPHEQGACLEILLPLVAQE